MATANRGTFRKGEKRPNQGKRGPSKATKELKDMILGALDKAGGQAYLQRQATAQPAAFLTLLGKVLPKDMHLDGGVKLNVTIKKMS